MSTQHAQKEFLFLVLVVNSAQFQKLYAQSPILMCFYPSYVTQHKCFVVTLGQLLTLLPTQFTRCHLPR